MNNQPEWREKYQRSQEKVKEYFDLLAAEREKSKIEGWYEGRQYERKLIQEEIEELQKQLAAERSKYESFVPLDDQIAIAQQPLVDALKFIRDNANEGVLQALATDTLAKVGAYPLPDGRTQ